MPLMRGTMYSSPNILLTGTSSGAGKYFYRNMQNASTIRHKDWLENPSNLKELKPDIVIHSAFDASHKIYDYGEYFKSNLDFTRALLQTRPSHFLFLSSVAVYGEENTNYKLSKLLCENMIRDYTDNHSILRCSAILGPDMRPNSLIKILYGLEDQLTLSKESTFNYVLQSDLLEFVNTCIGKQIFWNL
jgi:nucleoside-diphosphate-sugar epimerase